MPLQLPRTVGTVLAALLLTACTASTDPGSEPGADPSGTGAATTGSPSAGGSTTPDGGGEGSPPVVPVPEDRVGGADCALTEDQLRRVVRDWRRVDGSVDRPDHRRWTRALEARVRRVAASAEGCAGERRLQRFQAAVERIDRRAERSQVDYDAYDRAVELGDAWLRAVGLGVKELSRG